MKLIVDNSNVATIPVGNLMDLAGQARELADQIDAGEYGDVRRILVVLDGAPLKLQYWGDTATSYELMGILHAANMLVFADDVID